MLLNQVTNACGVGDALLIVPPFAALDRPSLGCHLLQSIARRENFRVSVLYANMLLAQEIGEREYSSICYSPIGDLVGERLFAPLVFGSKVPTFCYSTTPTEQVRRSSRATTGLTDVDLPGIQKRLNTWVHRLAEAIRDSGYSVVGSSTTFEQTLSSIAILERVKEIAPAAITIMGGANCEGEMACGLLELGRTVDYFFSGESEETFVEFLQWIRDGRHWPNRIIQGHPCIDLDVLPTPSFEEYYEQFRAFLPQSELWRSENVWLPYESSRGCWWGQKHHCTFCGLNGEGIGFREKSAERVIEDLSLLVRSHPTRKVCMTDNIMPFRYFHTLIPSLAATQLHLDIFYEQKANLSLEKLLALKEAGVTRIQPGIEALSSALLKRMNKGTTAAQNIALLRYARAADVQLSWNLLYGFPGDQDDDYTSTIALIRLLHHLEPPGGPYHLSIDRFSPYFATPEKYGITCVRPIAHYADVFPRDSHLSKIAYHFTGDYESSSRRNASLTETLLDEVELWRDAWTNRANVPVLAIAQISDGVFVLRDSRPCVETKEFEFISTEQMLVAITPHREFTPAVEWGLSRRVCVEIDGMYIPLATSAPALLQKYGDG